VHSKALSCRKSYAAAAAAMGLRLAGQSLHQEALRRASLGMRSLRAKQHNEAVGCKLQQRRLQSWTLLTGSETQLEEKIPMKPMLSRQLEVGADLSEMVQIAQNTWGLAFEVKIHRFLGFKTAVQKRLEAYRTQVPCNQEQEPSSFRTVYQDRAEKARAMNKQKLEKTKRIHHAQAQILSTQEAILQVRQERASSLRKLQWQHWQHDKLLPAKWNARLVKARMALRQQRLQLSSMKFGTFLARAVLEERANKAFAQNQHKLEVARRVDAQLSRKVAQKQLRLEDHMEKAAERRACLLQSKLTVAKQTERVKDMSTTSHRQPAMTIFGTGIAKTQAAKTCSDKVRELNMRKRAVAARVRQNLTAAKAAEKQELQRQQERASRQRQRILDKRSWLAASHGLLVQAKARGSQDLKAAAAAAMGLRLAGQSLHQENSRRASMAMRSLRAKQHNEVVERKLQQRCSLSDSEWTLVSSPSSQEALSEMVQVAASSQGLAFEVTRAVAPGFKTPAQRRLEAYAESPGMPDAERPWQLVHFAGQCQEMDVFSACQKKPVRVMPFSGFLASQDRAEKAGMSNVQKLEVAKQARSHLVNLLVQKRCNLEFRLQRASENRSKLLKQRVKVPRPVQLKPKVAKSCPTASQLPSSALLRAQNAQTENLQKLAKVQEVRRELALQLAKKKSQVQLRMEQAAQRAKLQLLQRRHRASCHLDQVLIKSSVCHRRRLFSAARLRLTLFGREMKSDTLRISLMAERSKHARQHNISVQLAKTYNSYVSDLLSQAQPMIAPEKQPGKLLAELHAEKLHVLNLQKREAGKRVRQDLQHDMAKREHRLQQKMERAAERHEVQLEKRKPRSKQAKDKSDSTKSLGSWLASFFSLRA